MAAWLSVRDLHPAQLDNKAAARLQANPVPGLDAGRLQALLARGRSLKAWLAWLAGYDLWVLGRTDAGYPSRLEQRLGALAPPLLYGCGSSELLDRGGLAVVGSRNAHVRCLAFARQAAARCAGEGFQVVSGGARGVDQAAMMTTLGEGGEVVGVLPGSLHKAAASSRWREGVADGRLALMTPFEPDAEFSVGVAMGRNRFIYLLSDWALVVDAAAGSGGAWAGAQEALKQGFVPVFVYRGESASAGNDLLLAQGAVPLTFSDLDRKKFSRWLKNKAAGLEDNQVPQQPSLF